MSDKKALVIDDTEANRVFFERLLAQAGFEVVSAGDGAHAMELIKSSTAFSLAIVDMEIPDVSGLDLTRRIRQAHPEAYIVVATMHDERSIMDSAFNKGCNVFLVKPHGFMELFKRLTTHDAKVTEQPLIIDQYGAREYFPSTV